MSQVVIQKLNKKESSEMEAAIRYFSIVSATTGARLSQTEIELLAFTSLRGTITPVSAREEFAKMFNSSVGTVENLKLRLTRKGFMTKVEEKYRVNPKLLIDFSNRDIVLQVRLSVDGEPKDGNDTNT